MAPARGAARGRVQGLGGDPGRARTPDRARGAGRPGRRDRADRARQRPVAGGGGGAVGRARAHAAARGRARAPPLCAVHGGRRPAARRRVRAHAGGGARSGWLRRGAGAAVALADVGRGDPRAPAAMDAARGARRRHARQRRRPVPAVGAAGRSLRRRAHRGGLGVGAPPPVRVRGRGHRRTRPPAALPGALHAHAGSPSAVPRRWRAGPGAGPGHVPPCGAVGGRVGSAGGLAELCGQWAAARATPRR